HRIIQMFPGGGQDFIHCDRSDAPLLMPRAGLQFTTEAGRAVINHRMVAAAREPLAGKGARGKNSHTRSSDTGGEGHWSAVVPKKQRGTSKNRGAHTRRAVAAKIRRSTAPFAQQFQRAIAFLD